MLIIRWNGLVKAKAMEVVCLRYWQDIVCLRVMSMLSWRGKVLCLPFWLRLSTFKQHS